MNRPQARDQAESKQRRDLVVLWAFFAVWAGCSFGAFYFNVIRPFSYSRPETWSIALLGAAFTGPLAGLGVYYLWRMIRTTLDDSKFGVVSLTPSAQPVDPGDALKAVLRFHDCAPDLRELDVELRCLKVTLTKRSRTGIVPVEELYWKTSQRIPLRHRRADLEFDIPDDAPVTDLPGERRGESGWQFLPVEAGKPWAFHRWEVFVSASLPGIDLVRSFPVIVGQKGTKIAGTRDTRHGSAG